MFSCDGLLERWIFRAENISLSGNMNLPGWGIYYRRSHSYAQYRVRHLIQPAKVEYAVGEVYQYVLPSPVQVRSGDVVGIKYSKNPAQYTNILKLAFLDMGSHFGTVSYRNTRGTQFSFPYYYGDYIPDSRYVPLVTPVLCKQMNFVRNLSFYFIV